MFYTQTKCAQIQQQKNHKKEGKKTEIKVFFFESHWRFRMITHVNFCVNASNFKSFGDRAKKSSKTYKQPIGSKMNRINVKKTRRNSNIWLNMLIQFGLYFVFFSPQQLLACVPFSDSIDHQFFFLFFRSFSRFWIFYFFSCLVAASNQQEKRTRERNILVSSNFLFVNGIFFLCWLPTLLPMNKQAEK